jgi:DNA gyrase/topoisomerase IV subunit B
MNNSKEEKIVIQALSEVEACRRRPGLYAGDVTRADLLIRECADNSCDEISAGYGDTILISSNLNGYCFVSDNGRGLPIEMNQDIPGVTSAEVSFTKFHAGSKFEGTTVNRVGMNGVGSAVVSALSEIYIVLSKITEYNWNKSTPEVAKVWQSAGPRSKKDLFYIVATQKGIKSFESAGKLKDLEKLIFKGVKNFVSLPEGQSTIVLFKPDPEIFEVPEASIPINNLQYFLLIQEKFYNKKVGIYIDGQKLNNTFKPYKFEVLRTVVPKDTSYNPTVSIYLTLEVNPNLGKCSSYGSINGLDCGSGYHINLAKNLFKTALKDYYKLKYDDYLLEGLDFGVIILASEVNFSSQTKENLKAITKVKPEDFKDVIKDIQKLFRKDPDYWDSHIKRLEMLADSMRNISAIEKSQKIIDSSSGSAFYKSKASMVDGFSDATAGANDRWNCELFLCFTGETKVLLSSGENISFVDLVKRKKESNVPLFTYSCPCKEDRSINLAEILEARKIKQSSRIYTITLSNGEHFRCTPEHKILLYTGAYCKAEDLKVDDILMPVFLDKSTSRVVKTEKADLIEDVYCLEVDTPEHNFALGCGVFVSNCEGLSPAGSLKAARQAADVKYCAIMPLRGKVLDTSDCSAEKMMDNKEFFTIFSVLGLGIEANSVIKDAKTPEEAYMILQKRSRYGKILISCDEDVDGLAIRKGILYTFAKFARFMIDFGLVYVAESPIFEQGGKYYYACDPFDKSTGFPIGLVPSRHFRRFKGLGSLDDEDVYKSFFDHSTRKLVQVTPDYMDYAMGLVEDIDKRKKLLFDEGVLTNPYNFTDL